MQSNHPNKHLMLYLGLILLFSTSCTLADKGVNLCPPGKSIKSKDGTQRLALIVGVGRYKSNKITSLLGPPEDAKRFYELLTGKQGYGFPKENVCLLLNEEATTENVKKAFTELLVDRAGNKDEAVFYYAGHGSQITDTNQDEPDGMDETFVFHDARTGNVKEFTDDEFDGLLQALYTKTQQITVFLDSCNSGTAIRGDEAFVSRYLPPLKNTAIKRSADDKPPQNNEKGGWVSDSLPGIVVFTAAGDGTPALEKEAHGVFTDAVITSLGQLNANKLTYAQAARQISPLMKAESYQIPYFQGDLQRIVFSNQSRTQPLSWEVIKAGEKISIGGLPLPGIGTNAEFRVYDGLVSKADTQDPSKVKAVIVIDHSNGINATAHILSRPKDAKAIKPGDLAVLARPGDQQAKLKVTLSLKSQTEGIPANKAVKLKSVLSKHPDANKVISIVSAKGDFEISLAKDGQYVIKGPENTVRNTLADEEKVIDNLWSHAKQRVFSALRGEGGSEFVDQETLGMQVVPAKNQDSCTKGIKWPLKDADSHGPQEIPECYKWNVKVTLSGKSPSPLLIGGLVLSTDGSILGFPADNTSAPLKPGETIVFAAKGETFKAIPPLNIQDQVIVFGTKEDNPVPWAKLTKSSAERGGDVKNGLYRTMDRYLTGTRAAKVADEPEAATDTTWTLSSMTMRVFKPQQ